jgi:hypothetical protein
VWHKICHRTKTGAQEVKSDAKTREALFSRDTGPYGNTQNIFINLTTLCNFQGIISTDSSAKMRAIENKYSLRMVQISTHTGASSEHGVFEEKF